MAVVAFMVLIINLSL